MAILHIYTLKNSNKIKKQSALAGCFLLARLRNFAAKKLLYTVFQFSVIIKMFIVRILNAGKYITKERMTWKRGKDGS